MQKTQESVGGLIRNLENDFINGTTTISEYVSYSLYEVLNTIDAYLNSKHLTGDKDSLEREKPFFNIVLAIRNIWFRATDLDRKHIRFKSDKASDEFANYLATIQLQRWMDKENFGQFLNDWGLMLASYGSAVCKFVKKGGRLVPSVVSWNRLIVDSVSFEDNPVIEILELTPAQLRMNKAYDQDQVENLIDAVRTRQTTGKVNKDNISNYIRLYEIHGQLPLSYLTGKEKDEKTYVEQMHVVSYISGDKKGEYEDFTLVSGRAENPYMLTHLIREDGKTLSLGAVQTASEAQWMNNHTIKNIKDQLDLSSKIIFQTSDPNFVNQNILKKIEQGQILITAKDQPITHVASQANDITSLQNFGMAWKNLAQEQTSTPDILRGENMPSGTAYRQAAIIQQESHSNFEIMKENKGLALEQMMRRWITPHLMTKMDTTKEISADLDAYGIDKIDKRFIRNTAIKEFNSKVVALALEETDEVPNLDQEMQGVKQQLDEQEMRYFKPSDIKTKTWKEYLKDYEGEASYEIVPENTDKEATFTTLSTLFTTVATNPMILQDPNAKMLFNKILSETGRVSPMEIKEMNQTATPAMAQPMAGGSVAAPNNQMMK